MAPVSETVDLELLVTAKAYPTVSQTYGEAVCVAGVRLDTPQPEWARLYPVRFRDLPRDKQFRKWEVVRLRGWNHSGDRRLESWRPDTDSIERARAIPAGGHWAERRERVEPLMGPTMCELNKGHAGGGLGPSLGLVRARHVAKLVVREAEGWSVEQRGRLAQPSLLGEKPVLDKPGHSFAYHWFCEASACRGHTQTIVDWELGQAYRSWARQGYDVVEAIREKWLNQMCAEDREVSFFVGDQHQHPGQFLVLGTFYPRPVPDRNQLSLAIG